MDFDTSRVYLIPYRYSIVRVLDEPLGMINPYREGDNDSEAKCIICRRNCKMHATSFRLLCSLTSFKSTCWCDNVWRCYLTQRALYACPHYQNKSSRTG